MKNTFSGFYQADQSELKKLWDESVFIFDTNVLLNLYEYCSESRDELLEVLGNLSGRIWIPYHVGLEFQLERLNVIAKKQSQFLTAKNAIQDAFNNIENEFLKVELKTRHTHSSPTEINDGIQALRQKVLSSLEKLQERSTAVGGADSIRMKLDELFEEKVGHPPPGQDSVDAIIKEGELRFSQRIPPGYSDGRKMLKENPVFSFGGIVYKKAFGDLIIWLQIIEHAKASNIKNVVFITDDAKEDWWQQPKGNGDVRIGARPELVDEIKRTANVDRFQMYNTVGFLTDANLYLGSNVTASTIADIRDVAHIYYQRVSSLYARQHHETEAAVYKWLLNNDNVIINDGYPDFIALSDNAKIGFEVMRFLHPSIGLHKIDDAIFRATDAIFKDGYTEITIIAILPNKQSCEEFSTALKSQKQRRNSFVYILVGGLENADEGEELEFVPYQML